MILSVEIKPAPDGDGFCLYPGASSPVWFKHEAQAIAYAREVFVEAEVLLFDEKGGVKARYPSTQRDQPRPKP